MKETDIPARHPRHEKNRPPGAVFLFAPVRRIVQRRLPDATGYALFRPPGFLALRARCSSPRFAGEGIQMAAAPGKGYHCTAVAALSARRMRACQLSGVWYWVSPLSIWTAICMVLPLANISPLSRSLMR